MDDEIRQILARSARLSVDTATLDVDDDLYAAGLTSHASVNVMLDLEDAFDIEFADNMLRKDTFASITAIRHALTQVGAHE